MARCIAGQEPIAGASGREHGLRGRGGDTPSQGELVAYAILGWPGNALDIALSAYADVVVPALGGIHHRTFVVEGGCEWLQRGEATPDALAAAVDGQQAGRIVGFELVCARAGRLPVPPDRIDAGCFAPLFPGLERGEANGARC